MYLLVSIANSQTSVVKLSVMKYLITYIQADVVMKYVNAVYLCMHKESIFQYQWPDIQKHWMSSLC